MSKIGKKSIIIPNSVQVKVSNDIVTVKGSKGELQQKIPPKVTITVMENEMKVGVANPKDRRQRALWGTVRALLANMIAGVVRPFEKKLEIVGVGYRATVFQDQLNLSLGFSHPVELSIPKGLEVKVDKNVITIIGVDKQAVGEFAAFIRSHRPPEPYKGKGIKYQDEVIRRKAGKVVKTVGAS